MFSHLLACGLARVRCDFRTFYFLRVILSSFWDLLRGQDHLRAYSVWNLLRGQDLLRDFFRDNDLFT